MRYYVDGYNLLFSLSAAASPLATHRARLIEELSAALQETGWCVALVFDAAETAGEATRSTMGSLDIVYTAQGESADAYILSEIERHPSSCIVVSDDQRLLRLVRHLGAHSLGLEPFLRRLARRRSLGEANIPDGEHDVSHTERERWISIFEKRLEDNQTES